MFVIVLNQSNLVTDGQNNKLVYKFPNSVTFKDKYIAVSSISMYYSWFNISDSYKNNVITYTWDTGTAIVYTINIPDGIYEISDLNNLIQFECIKNGTYWAISGVNYYPFELKVNPNRYAVQLNTFLVPIAPPTGTTTPPTVGWPTVAQNPVVTFPQNIDVILGYVSGTLTHFSSDNNLNNAYTPPTPATKATYYATKDGAGTLSYLSNTNPNVQPNSSILFSISNIINPYALPSSIIYSLSPAVAIGELIVDRPPNFMWNRMIDGTYNEIRLNLLGTDLQPLQVRDPAMTILLTIRDKDENTMAGK
jgi:hypothetical protein